MAIMITDECINCGACEPECPNNAIYEGGAQWRWADGTTLKEVKTADGATVRIERQTENGYDIVEAAMPAVISVVEKINEPRYPSFKGIMAAKSKPLTTLSIADAGIEADQVGLAHATSKVAEFANRAPRQAGQIVKDEGDGGLKVAEFLASQKFV